MTDWPINIPLPLAAAAAALYAAWLIWTLVVLPLSGRIKLTSSWDVLLVVHVTDFLTFIGRVLWVVSCGRVGGAA